MQKSTRIANKYDKGAKAEKYIQNLAQSTFLLDWCYFNPKRADGREICDLLIAFGSTAVIWQIKNRRLSTDGLHKEQDLRENSRQLKGARRILLNLDQPIILDNPLRGSEPFDPRQISEVFLISAMAGPNPYLKNSCDSIGSITASTGIVHIFTRNETKRILSELDTISDFTCYLRAKEQLLTNKQQVKLFIDGDESDLLAMFLLEGRTFERLLDSNFVAVQNGYWKSFVRSKRYRLGKEADKVSYNWDMMIKKAHERYKYDNLETPGCYEIIAREMAKLNRFQRRCASEALTDAIQNPNVGKRCFEIDGTTYCYWLDDQNVKREERVARLVFLCIVSRLKFGNLKVIGIATESGRSALRSFDFCYHEVDEITDEVINEAKEIQVKTGLLTNTTVRHERKTEYAAIP